MAVDLTTGGGRETVSVGHNERGVFVYFHGDGKSSYSWHMSALEARALGAALVTEALDAPDGDLDRPTREAPAHG